MSPEPPASISIPQAPSAPRSGVLAVALTLCAGIALLGAWRLEPPGVVGASAAAEEFSAERALVHLQGLIGPASSGGSRAMGSANNARARDYLLTSLAELGLEPEVQDQFVVSQRYLCSGRVRNVLAEVPGSDPALPGILLVAHYDCVGAGQGAGDDGSGVAALLEIARALRASPQALRSVFLLFSDGEETGLLGAEAFAGIYARGGAGQSEIELLAPHPWMQRVGAVINLEARGTRGPSLMFQTGPQSGRLVRALAEHAPRPVLGSSFSAVYEELPNNTDLTVFKDRGLPGLNFAFIGGVEHYHTSLDDLAHLDLRSLQHHGTNVLPLVRALAAEPVASSVDPDYVYFDLLSKVVVRWPVGVSPILAGLGLALLLLTGGLLARGGQAGWLVRGVLWGLLGLGLAVLFGFALGQGAARCSWPGIPFPAEPTPWVLLAFALALSAATLAAQLCHRAGFWGAWLVTWGAWGGLGLALSLSRWVGFSYLFVVPLLAAGLGGLIGAGPGRTRPGLAALAGLLPLSAATLLLAPLLVLVYQALGLQAFPLSIQDSWPAIALFPVVAILGVIPLFPLLCLRGAGRGALLFAALGFSVLAAIMAPSARLHATHPARAADPHAHIPGQRGDVPYRGDLAFVQTFHDLQSEPWIDAAWYLFPAFPFHPYASDRDESYPHGRGQTPPDFLLSAPSAFGLDLAEPLPGLEAYRAQAHPLSGAEPPRLDGLSVEAHGQGRMVRFRLFSPRGAPILALFFPPGGRPQRLLIEGKPAPVASGHWCLNAPPEGLAIELFFPQGQSPSAAVQFIDATPGLPRSGAVLRELRDSEGSPTTRTADLHVHSVTYPL